MTPKERRGNTDRMEEIVNRIYVELESMKDATEKVELHLPIPQLQLDGILLKLTGSEIGSEYVIKNARSPYFTITKYDDIQILNKVADITEQLSSKEKQILKGWCDNWQEAECTDFTEIGNAALQIHQVEYADGVESYEQLGEVLLKKSGIESKLKRFDIPKLSTSVCQYINYEAIGEAYEALDDKNHYPVKENGTVCGYVLDDSKINIYKFRKDELLEKNTEDLFQECRDYINECMGLNMQAEHYREKQEREQIEK